MKAVKKLITTDVYISLAGTLENLVSQWDDAAKLSEDGKATKAKVRLHNFCGWCSLLTNIIEGR